MPYIMHLDGDAFFVSVEMAKDPSLRGRPVVTGQERGIASALSYEAKALGITRAMPVFQIRREFPQVAVVSSDYEAYAVFSRRMMNIVRRYTDVVEEYSIDECFAEFPGDPGRQTLQEIKSAIRRELGISVSLGLGPTKVLAKTASKRNKPDGLTILAPGEIPAILASTPVDKVWGIGSATAFALRKKGVKTAYELAQKPLAWVEEHFSKPVAEMWHELRGVSVHGVNGGLPEAQKSIMKTRTFVPASRDRSYVFSQLSKNVENACRKARELGLAACELSVYLKTRDFSYASGSCRFVMPTDSPFEAIEQARAIYDSIFDPQALYRATGVTLLGLMPALARQYDLFGQTEEKREGSAVFSAVDRLNRKYGKSVVHIATSSRALVPEERGEGRKLAIPFLGEAR
ncbi:MAG TPA: DNA polymerase IV [Candidatus Paceibacterota bacterium]|nr:DNA polymerase IV [Candidatus Paceibacterota bacterium]